MALFFFRFELDCVIAHSINLIINCFIINITKDFAWTVASSAWVKVVFETEMNENIYIERSCILN